MQPRIDHPAFSLPDVFGALQGIAAAIEQTDLSDTTLELVFLRASQINGCSVCVHGHAHALRKAGESEERIAALAAWRDAPCFTGPERAAFDLAEAVTRLSDRPDPVPDAVWEQVTRHYNETQLAGLVLAIANVNLWNRLNAATRQVAGATW